MQQFQQLPVAAQRVVAELIALLGKQRASVAPENLDEGATILSHTVLGVPMAWPENEFMNPEFYGSWSDRSDITDSTEYVRNLRRIQWGPK